MAIPFLPEPAPVTSLAPNDPLSTAEEKIETHIRESHYMILEDVENLKQNIKSVHVKAS
jgi:hypothetical protein